MDDKAVEDDGQIPASKPVPVLLKPKAALKSPVRPDMVRSALDCFLWKAWRTLAWLI